MNAPHPAEHIVLNEDEKKISYAEDQKIADAGTFTLLKEDHTLGNIIRMSLLADGRVLFAGYRMPHPLENRMLIKIKTRPGYKSTHAPRTRGQGATADGSSGC